MEQRKVPKKRKHGIRTGNTLRNCYLCKKAYFNTFCGMLKEKSDSDCITGKKLEKTSKVKTALREVRPNLLGNPFRGRDRFVASGKKHRGDSQKCNGTKGTCGKITRVHFKDEYKFLKTLPAKDAVELSCIDLSRKDYVNHKMDYY